MVRKSLFLGLTGMLAVVFVYLVVQGRRQEKLHQQALRPVEVIKASKPTPTRVLAPRDIEVVESKTEFAGAKPKTATHRLVLLAKGQLSYRGIILRFTYLGAGERVLETRTQQVPEVLLPGQARALAEIVIENLPSGTLKAAVQVLSADIDPGAQGPAPNRQ